MKLKWISTAILVAAVTPHSALSQDRGNRRYPPQLEGARVEVYKTVGDVKLNMYIFTPADHRPADQRPAIVFFFGGGWRSGTPAQFHEQAKYLASRGMVAMTADYRVSSRHGTKANACVSDAKSAIRWIRQRAATLGVDPQRIVAAGGSAGGHIAACTAVVPGFDESGEDTSISSVPNATVLFNPALVLAEVDGESLPNPRQLATLGERMGVEPALLSPYHQVKSGCPPTLILHGEADTTVSYRTAELFTQAMHKDGNRCELVGFPGQGHGFFNFGRGDNGNYLKTTRRMDEFLGKLGYLQGNPTISEPPEQPAR